MMNGRKGLLAGLCCAALLCGCGRALAGREASANAGYVLDKQAVLSAIGAVEADGGTQHWESSLVFDSQQEGEGAAPPKDVPPRVLEALKQPNPLTWMDDAQAGSLTLSFAVDDPSAAYQWQYRALEEDGSMPEADEENIDEGWYDLEGAVESTLSYPLSVSAAAYAYRCLATCEDGAALASDAVQPVTPEVARWVLEGRVQDLAILRWGIELGTLKAKVIDFMTGSVIDLETGRAVAILFGEDLIAVGTGERIGRVDRWHRTVYLDQDTAESERPVLLRGGEAADTADKVEEKNAKAAQ